jgi:hypothetical protein
MNDKNETGSQLFARLLSSQQTQPNRNSESVNSNVNYLNTQDKTMLITKKLENDLMINKSLKLDPDIFPNGIENKSIVEIFGKVGCGKTELILHFIARYLMPPLWKIDDTNQVNLTYFSIHDPNDFKELPKCILINNDSKVFILRLFTIMEQRITSLITSLNDLIQKKIKKFIEHNLKNLIVYQSYESEQFIYSIAAAENYIQSILINSINNNYIMPIFIDTINSCYEFIDRYQKNIGLIDNAANFTENYSINLVKKLTERYNVCIIASRGDFYNKNSDNYTYKNWQAILNKRIELSIKINKIKTNEDDNENDENSINEKQQINDEKIFQFKLIEYSTKSLLNIKSDNKIDQNNKISNCLIDKAFIINNSGFNFKNY